MTQEFYLLINLRKAAARFEVTLSNTDKLEMIEWIDKVDKYIAGEYSEEIYEHQFDPEFKSLLRQYRDGELFEKHNNE